MFPSLNKLSTKSDQGQIRETKEKIEIFEGPRMVATHERSLGHGALATQREHRPPRGQSKQIFEVNPDEEALLKIEPRIAEYVEAIKKQTRIRTSLALRHLLRMLQDYPREPFLTSVQLAEKYKLFDLERLEKMVLKRIAADYFILPPGEDEDE